MQQQQYHLWNLRQDEMLEYLFIETLRRRAIDMGKKLVLSFMSVLLFMLILVPTIVIGIPVFVLVLSYLSVLLFMLILVPTILIGIKYNISMSNLFAFNVLKHCLHFKGVRCDNTRLVLVESFDEWKAKVKQRALTYDCGNPLKVNPFYYTGLETLAEINVFRDFVNILINSLNSNPIILNRRM